MIKRFWGAPSKPFLYLRSDKLKVGKMKDKKTPILYSIDVRIIELTVSYFIMPSLACSRMCLRIFLTPRGLEPTKLPDAR